MMRNLIIVSVVLSLLVFLGTPTASFVGGVLPHLYTGRIVAAPVAPSTTVAAQTFTTALDRTGVFSLTEKLLYGTALLDYSSKPIGAADGSSVLHIEVLSPQLNAARTSFMFTLNLTPRAASNGQTQISLFHATFSFIVVGSEFSGYSSTVDSSYVFARNGNMDQIPAVAPPATLPNSGPPTTATGLYDFTNTEISALSPFLYDVGTAPSACGAIMVGSQWILRADKCESFIAHVFVTGFEQTGETTSLATPNAAQEALVSPIGQVDLIASAATIYDTDSLADGITYTYALTNKPRYVQFSIIAIGIRQYSSAVYPTQTVPALIDQFISGAPGVYQVDTVFPVNPSTGSATLSLVSSLNPAATPIIGAPDNFYLPTNIAHQFCGIVGMNLQNTGAPTADNVIEFYADEFSFSTSPDPTVTYHFTDPTNNAIQLISPSADLRLECVTFTKRNACFEVITPFTGTQISGATIASSTTSNVNLYIGVPPTNGYSASVDPNYIEDLYLVNMDQKTTVPGTYTYTFQYNSAQNKGYEGVLYISTIETTLPVPSAPSTATTYFQTITIEVFGNLVYSATTPISLNPLLLHFSFVNYVTPLNNQVKITYTTDLTSTGAGFHNVLQFGLADHKNLLSLTGTCVGICPQVTGYTSGINYGTVPPTCVLCQTSFNLVFSPVLGVCDCLPHYNRASSTAFCTPCSIPLCDQCTTAQDTCLQCTPHSTFININNKALGCACDAGYYSSEYKCLPCAPGCLTCTNGATCTTCVANQDTRLAPSANCACKPGFYESGSPVCSKCSPNCLTCKTSSTVCETCDPNAFKDGQTCQCNPGFFLLISATGGVCTPCISSCATCSVTANQCDTCLAPRTKSGTSCICPPVTYIERNGVCLDAKCQSIDPNCQSCGIILSTGQAFCRACGGANMLAATDGTTCQCAVGYVKIAGSCVACGTGCATCDASLKCTACAIGFASNTTTTCACPAANYLSVINNGLYCQRCDPNCGVCTTGPSVCTTCINGFVAVANVCKCPTGFYPSADNVRCIACSNGCTSCLVNTLCSQCRDGYFLSNGACILSCPVGTYPDADECKQCSDNCRSCTTSLNCRACLPPFFLFAGACRSECPAGTFNISNVCIACTEPCATCTSSANTCTSCTTGLIFTGGVCSSSCPAGNYYDGVICRQCSPSCKSCVNSANQCTSCATGLFLVDGTCKPTCPYTVVDGICTQGCQSGQYLNTFTGQCASCAPACKTCVNSADYCTTCTVGFASAGRCVSACPPATTPISGNCLACDISCNGCTNTTVNCVRCAAGYYWLELKCVRTCPQTYYLDTSLGACKSCDSGCLVCSGPGRCTTCLNPQTPPVAGQCVGNTCGANCLDCELGVCKTCAAGFIWTGTACQAFCPPGSSPVSGVCVCSSGYLYLNSCVFTCPSGTVPAGNTCQPCNSPCATCSGNPNQCTTCVPPFAINLITNKCENNVPCPFGKYRDQFGQCVFICSAGNYFLDNACYEASCPSGYTADANNRVCNKNTVPTGCTIPFFLQGVVCVTRCDVGFFPNSANRVCEACSSNCNTCLNQLACSSCAAGFELDSNFKCVVSTACTAPYVRYNNQCIAACPTGTYNNNGYCIRRCPEATYFWGQGCYETCPTGLRTADACVLVCPAGTTKEGNVCTSSINTCSSSQFFNSATGRCENCRTPCTSCQVAATICTGCPSGFVLEGTICRQVPTTCTGATYPTPLGCVACPVRCATCVEGPQCTSCASGYTNNGIDCVPNTGPTNRPVQLQLLNTYVRGNTLFYEVRPTIIPNNLATTLSSQFFLFVPASLSNNPTVTNWIQGTSVFMALSYGSASIPVDDAYIILNNALLGPTYLGMGYTTADAYLFVKVTPNVAPAPPNVVIPTNAFSSKTVTLEKLPAVYSRVNSQTFAKTNALRDRNFVIGKK